MTDSPALLLHDLPRCGFGRVVRFLGCTGNTEFCVEWYHGSPLWGRSWHHSSPGFVFIVRNLLTCLRRHYAEIFRVLPHIITLVRYTKPVTDFYCRSTLGHWRAGLCIILYCPSSYIKVRYVPNKCAHQNRFFTEHVSQCWVIFQTYNRNAGLAYLEDLDAVEAPARYSLV